jgi:hypothetical protein
VVLMVNNCGIVKAGFLGRAWALVGEERTASR